MPLFFRRWGLLTQARELLSTARSVDEVLEILRARARAIAEADGVAVIRRFDDEVEYVGEDSISPLWAGQRFPIRHCVTGMAILTRAPIVIPDIYQDARVPLNAYLATFVRSMAAFPLGGPAPIAALGLYWREPHPIRPEVMALVDLLAQSANSAFEQIAIRAEQQVTRGAGGGTGWFGGAARPAVAP